MIETYKSDIAPQDKIPKSHHGSDRATHTGLHTSAAPDPRTHEQSEPSLINNFADLNLHDIPRASHIQSFNFPQQEASTTVGPNKSTSSNKDKVPPSMYEQSTPKNVPFMHAPYPYHYYGMPPPQGYYYPYPAMNHNMAPPSHMSAPPSPHVYSQPMYNNHLPIPQTFSQPPLQPIVNHYRDVPHALNPQNPSPLYPISSTGEFSNWIRTLMDHLKSAQYGDLIPNKHGVAARTPSHWEELGLQWLFSTYVKKDFYPKWVKQAQEASVPLFTILQRAMTLAMQATDITIIMRKLRDLHFEGKEPAFIFNANVQSIISQIDTKELTQYEPLIKDCILNALAGPYSTINKEFRTSQSPYSISDIYTRISAEYDYITTT
ncbi:gag protein NDAI_0A01420, partial [Naumovozyma dairenensis CBS 421]